MKILLIGDYIDDIYFIGESNSLANEEPVLKFIPSSHYVTPGGIGYCETLFKSFLPTAEIKLVKLSSTSIIRYIDEKWNRNLITIHNRPQLVSELHNPLVITSMVNDYQPDLVFMWTDSEADDECYKLSTRHGDRHEIALAIWPLTTTAIDLSDSSASYYTDADFAKVYANDLFDEDYGSYAPFCMVGTGSKETKLSFKGKYNASGGTYNIPVSPVPFLIDTCGAGDTYFTSFLSHLILEDKLKEYTSEDLLKAMFIAESAAHLTCLHRGTYIPTWSEVLEKHKELHASKHH